MKLISLNLQISNPKLQEVADLLDAQKADYVFLQEVLMDGASDAAQTINDLMEHPYASVKTNVVETYATSKGTAYTQGMSVLFHGSIASTQSIELQNVAGDKHTRTAQLIEAGYLCETCLPDYQHTMDVYNFINIHFANKPNNAVQLKQIIDAADERYLYPIIVGDFNMSRTMFYETKYFWGKAYKSSVEFTNYVSYPGSEEFSQIDICLIPRSMTFQKITTFEGLSDHNAVMYEIDDSEFSANDTIQYVYPNNWADHVKVSSKIRGQST